MTNEEKVGNVNYVKRIFLTPKNIYKERERQYYVRIKDKSHKLKKWLYEK